MKKSIIVLLHIAYWISVLYEPIFQLTSQHNAEYKEILTVRIGFGIGFRLVIFYMIYFWLFPKFLSSRKIGIFAITGFVLIVIISVGISFYIKSLYPEGSVRSWYIVSYIFTGLYTGLAACLVRGFIFWYSDIRYKEELVKKNLQTELALLRAQINPHFLFNTLNNIDILIEKEPKSASTYLNKLSDIMRFTIYDSSSEKINLCEELEYIEKYIDLQRIRTSNRDFVRYEVTGNPDRLEIAPMLFIPFIENAFKHATDKKIEHAINILIKIHKNRITFECINAIDNTFILKQQEGGVGMELIRNRLHLIYPNHQLDIQKSTDKYSVNLSLDLHES